MGKLFRFIVVFALLGPLTVLGQDWKAKFKQNYSHRGYFKDLRIESFAKDTSGQIQSLQQNLFHHRYNTRYQLDTSWELGIEFRNRLFYGEFLKTMTSFGDALEVDPGVIDMSWSWINNNNLVAHTAIDRMWVNYAKKNWEVRFGRQRINWGQNIVWNPNDLFNVLNFTDFDYEERPGSDAIYVQRYLKKSRSLHVAYKFTQDFDDAVIAGMYRFNKKNYDFQLLGGKYKRDLAVGAGWAGNIKKWGFKGESTYFYPLDDTINQTVLTSLSWDISYDNGLYWLISGLHNSNGVKNIQGLTALAPTSGGQLDLKSLMPNQYSLFTQISGAFNPLVSGSLAVIGAVDIEAAFFMPTISYSLKQNLDASLVGQSFILHQAGKLQALSNALFLRFKWSY